MTYSVRSFQDFLNFVRNKTGLEDTKKYDLYQVAELVPGALMCEVGSLLVKMLTSIVNCGATCMFEHWSGNLLFVETS